MIGLLLLSVGLSVVASVIVSRTMAARYLQMADRYVKDLIELAKKKIEEAYTNRDRHE